MKYLKTLSLFTLSVVTVGCSQPPAPASQATKAEASSTPAKTESFQSKLPADAPTLQVVTTGNTPPFSQQDSYGNMSGFDIDVMRAIGETQGFKVNFIKEPWQTLFTLVDSGKANLAIAAISYKPERAQKYNLSESYFYNPSAIMYKNPQLNIKTFNDLRGLRVGGLEGAKQIDSVRQANFASSITETKTPFLLYQALINDKVDAIVHDYPLLKDTANHHPEYKVTILPYEDRTNPLAQQVILMAKGNDELTQRVNEGIAKIKTDGTLKSIEDKWKVTVD